MLLINIFLFPLIGALILSLIKIDNKSIYKIIFVSLFFSIIPFLLNILIYIKFNSNSSDFQFVSYPIKNIGIGIDGISLIFLLLTTFLFVICIFYNCNIAYTITFLKSYMILFLLLESFVIGFFISLNAISFYVFFEITLIPIFFIIGIWGGKKKIYSAFKFFLYTFSGSLFFMFALIYLYNIFGTLDLQKLITLIPNIDFNKQLLLWIMFFISFAIKIPIFPFHTWLPDAHVESPTSGSVILAALLVKMGGYGFIRFSISMFPEASFYFSNFIIILSSISVIYSSLIAFSQNNIKKIIAYSSIAHMGIATAGLFSFYEEGLLGAIFHMVSHGLTSAALFFCIGILYNRTSTLEIKKYSGIINFIPKLGFMFILFSMSSIGLPGTSGFIGEFLSMIGIFKKILFFISFIGIGNILSAVYMLNLCKKIIWGTNYSKILNNYNLYNIEFFTLISLALFIILLGFYPNLILNNLKFSIANLLIKYKFL